MKRTTVVIATVLLTVLAVMNLHAAGQSQAATDRYPLTWLTPADMAARELRPDDRIVAAINDRVGIDLRVQVVPQGGWDRINVAIASGDLPDLGACRTFHHSTIRRNSGGRNSQGLR